MSPRKFLDGDHKHVKSGVVMNGPRPTPLKLKEESHAIHKQHNNHQQQTIRPVIIYTYSPEVIHTKPNDFMALVQKLTGHSGSKDQEQQHQQQQQQQHQQQQRHHQQPQQQQQQQQQEKKTLKSDVHVRNDNELSNDSGVTHERNTNMKAKSPMFNTPSNPYMGDIPLFTPNSSDYFCSPRHLFRFSDMVSSSPNTSTSLSPASQLLEFMKGLPDQYDQNI